MAEENNVKFCRREIGDETPAKFCMRPIKARNALNWCPECRAARLPLWPADDKPQAGQAVSVSADVFEATEGGS